MSINRLRQEEQKRQPHLDTEDGAQIAELETTRELNVGLLAHAQDPHTMSG